MPQRDRTEYLYLDRHGEPEIRYQSSAQIFTEDPTSWASSNASGFSGPSRSVSGVRFGRPERAALLADDGSVRRSPAVAAVVAFVEAEALAWGLDREECLSRVKAFAEQRNAGWKGGRG